MQQVVQVPLQLFAGAAEAGGADDQAHVGRSVEAVQRFAQFVALFAFDAAGDAACAGVVRHQHQVTTGEADEGGQGRALVAALFFLDLDDDFLAFAEHFLDVDAAFGGLLEVLAGDFLQRQEAVALGAEVDEGGFEAGLDASDPALVDVGFLLLACTRFDVQVIQALAVDQSNTQLFGLSCVNQHSFHVIPMGFRAAGNGDWRTRLSRSVSGACQGRRAVPVSSELQPNGAGIATTSPACCVVTEALVQEEESTVGSGRNEAS
ncbi:hypothetical protein D9M68_662780 [compost metagenome]